MSHSAGGNGKRYHRYAEPVNLDMGYFDIFQRIRIKVRLQY